MTKAFDRDALQRLRADLARMLAEADEAEAHVLAVHLSLAADEVAKKMDAIVID